MLPHTLLQATSTLEKIQACIESVLSEGAISRTQPKKNLKQKSPLCLNTVFLGDKSRDLLE